MAAAQLGTLVQHLCRLADAQRAANLSDAQLLEEFALRRDEAAFAALLQRHAPLVFGVCRRVLGNDHDAEDAFQATFLILVRKAGSIHSGESLGCWLYEIAYRTALRARTAAHKRRTRERQAHAMNEASPKSPAEAPCVDSFLDEELKRLPEQYRRPLVLCYLEGRTHAEAAELLGWPKGTVSGRLARARDLLCQRLEKRGLPLTATVLMATLAQNTNAAVPAPLLDATLRAGLSFAAGRAAGDGASAAAVALAREVLHVMIMSRLRLAVLALTLVGLLGGGLAYFARSDEQLPPFVGAAGLARGQVQKPLPAGATARMGTTAFRHGDRILSVAYTPDGKKLVTSSMDQTVRLWDAATGRELRRFDRSPNAREKELPSRPRKMPIGAAVIFDEFLTAVSFDGKYLAANRSDVVILWELESGKELHRFRGPWAGGTLLAFANGGKTLLVADHLDGVETWDVATGKAGKTIPGPSNPGGTAGLQSAGPQVSADGKWLAQPHIHNPKEPSYYSILLFDLAAGKEFGEIKITEKGVADIAECLTFSPDDRILAEATRDGKINLFDVASGKKLGSMKTSLNGRVVALAFGPGGRILALSRDDGSVELWDVKTHKRLNNLLGSSLPEVPGVNSHFGQHPVRSDLAFSPDGKRLAVGASGCGVRVFDLATGKEVGAGRSGHPAAVRSLGLAVDGKTLVTHARGDGIRFWNLATGEQVRQVLFSDPAIAGTLSADGATLAATTASKVVLYNSVTGQPVGQIRRQQQGPAALSLSPDGKTLAARGDRSEPTRLWDVATGKPLPTSEGEVSSPSEIPVFFEPGTRIRTSEVVFSPDGRLVAMQDRQDRLTLFDVASGSRLRQLPLAPGQVVQRFGFSPDGRGLATLNKDGTLTLFETVTGRKRTRFGKAAKVRGPDLSTMLSVVMLDTSLAGAETPYSLAFSPDARMLAASAIGPDIRLWSVLTGQELGTFRGHQGGITNLTFDATGKRLISGSMDSTALVWDVTGPAKALRPARGKLAEGLAEKLWADLAGDDAERAFTAIRVLCDAPADAVALFRQRVRPAVGPDSNHIAKLLADLDSKSFAVRNQATADLEGLGDLIVPAARKAMEGGTTLEVRQRLEQILKKLRLRPVQQETLAAIRSVEVLEHAGTTDARQVLETLTSGAAGSRLTEAARGSLRRLARPDQLP